MKDDVKEAFKRLLELSPEEFNAWRNILHHNVSNRDQDLVSKMTEAIPEAQVQNIMKK